MANRSFHRHQSLEKEIKTLHVKVTVGATGTVTATDGLGIASVSETSADNYTITLSDKYSYFKGAEVLPCTQSTFAIVSEAVATSKTVVIAFGTTQASGSFYVVLHLKNTSVTK